MKPLTTYIILDYNPYFSSSASANRWLTLIEGLKDLGVKVELLIYGVYKTKKEAATWKTSGDRNDATYQYIAPKLMTGYWKSRYHTYIGSRFREVRLLRKIIKRLSDKPSLIWTDSSLFGFKLALHLKEKRHDLKTFLELSEFLDIHKYNKGNFAQRKAANKRQQFFEQKAFFAYTGLALMTKTLLKHYESFPEPGPKLVHIPMTVDLDRFAPDIPTIEGFAQPYIAYIGVMNDAKDGVNILIKAFAKIHHQFPEQKIYLIGGWNYDTPNHQKLIKEYGLQNKIIWKGAFSRDQIPGIIKNASLLTLPRPDSKQAQGGFPTKLGEYLATGNPVCATTVGEIPDYLVDGESVYFAEPGSINAFSDAMKRALSNPDEAKRIGANGRKVAEKHFNKNIQAKELYNFLLQFN